MWQWAHTIIKFGRESFLCSAAAWHANAVGGGFSASREVETEPSVTIDRSEMAEELEAISKPSVRRS
jgi:hypothetical protein